MAKPILVGAVVYDPKVVVIWDIIKEFFEEKGCPLDYVFFSNYELQVRALIAGQIDVAWNSPLAWLDSLRQSDGKCRAIAMRDTDRDRKSHILVLKDSGIGAIADLKGKTVAFGAKDSPQATLIPTGLLQRDGLEPGRDFTAKRFDVLVGKHGDHIGGELDALKALMAGEVDACAVLDLNWANWSTDGTADPAKIGILTSTDRFDHCVFTVRNDIDSLHEAEFLRTLFMMSYDDPAHREMMDMEGLKKWEEGRTSGFAALTEAVEGQHFFA